ncbi:hypothetical protein HGO53_02465 [Wolbachia endosymbiont of Diaphorina citri]|jgi:Chromosome segregation ATPases|uniref:hypothetical protein n=1 Tax=Wolbachia endosymbiont of Diaphorina citri TaxID=116598 RepID=UPI0002EC98BA|nr:hypothetical protein [Wolbachia endosymbiont of Diaphorina citri]QJT94196.1 hypothetical protein HGO48_01755 [Wolbachia endosymbiont of Diaphorina citri]QJT95437.1 hypothetical protein HGO49_01755 [Wolbachia endosymbiont of Diaphorina citri]QJT96798.1 hypothetical protein HGO53_02465 [Wolbachia endosymbiont of Diaphorina citri]QLK11093.1 hypothetical protein FK497_01795 [Wolbachia endosymbiont of Diaphorina citri]QXY87375.1 hypothetical protein GZ064_05985 [Wolbachia endosymbiont of Diaphor
MLKENLFIAENQGLDVDEQKKNNILSFIEPCNDFQDFIRKLEEENLIWYFIGPLHKDENIKEQVSSKWKEEFQKFEQSINATHKKFAESLPSENFLVYTTQDNEFQIRFENKEKPIEISTLLRASDEGKVYNLSLGKDSQITATKKGSKRHYYFTGSSSCEMTINWQAKDSKGNSIDCSMTVEVNSKGIKRVIDEPKFGEITDPEEVLKLVEQNKEVFINGKTLHQAFTDMGKSVNNQQTPAEETFTKNSLQSPIPSSSGYSSLNTPSSRRSSLSISSEFNGEDEIFESDKFSDEEKHKQEDGLEEKVAELEKENTYLKKKNAELKSINTGITGESDEELSKLTKENQDLEKEVIRLKDELKRKEKELAEKDKDIERLEQKVTVLEQSQKDKNARITDLTDQLKDKESEIQSTNRINEELQKKLDQGETELSKLKEENTELINITKRIPKTDNNEKLLVEELKEKIDNLVKELNEVKIKNKDLEGEKEYLERKNEDLERKIQQLESGKSLADEMSEVNTNEEIDKLKQQFKAKEGMLQEELKSVKEALEKLQDILQQEKDLAAISTQTEVEYESRGIQANTQEIIVPKTQDQGTNAGIDASSSTDQKESKKEEDQINRTKSVNNLVPVDPPSFTDQKEKNRTNRPENIMDWPTPIPCDGLGADPAKPTKVLLDPKSTPAKGSEKSIS